MPTGACADPTYTLNGVRWDAPFRWYFQEASTPDLYDAAVVRELIESSFNNITGARNDCGLPDNVDASATYAGTTSKTPCPDTAREDVNVVGFVDLPPRESDLLAYVCTFGESPISRADIVINSDIRWALSEDECDGFQELLEATLTHEIGHIFGLGHVGERRHGDLTMSTLSNGPCATDEITLGLGDVLGLEELYSPE